jgi:hypothetical protein
LSKISGHEYQPDLKLCPFARPGKGALDHLPAVLTHELDQKLVESQLAAILGAPGVVGSRQPLLASGQVKSTSWPPSWGAPDVVGSRQPLLASGQVKSTSWPPSWVHRV